MRLLFPETCVLCGKSLIESEDIICLHCLYRLPRTNFHNDRENRVEKRFFGKIAVEQASSLFYFNKGSDFRHLIHLLKYKDRQDVGETLGRYAARELLQQGAFSDIDCIIPIPLHKKKERKRGYNQAECIAKGMSEVLKKPVELNGVHRVKANNTQTRKSVLQRWQNVQEIFELKDATLLQGKHILLIDDVLTTGATMEACAVVLLQVDGVKISLFTLAVA
ncbi:MAG: ComF family protein [Bacteroidales bacterium]|nr:ComF family protein [Bacteroidales bacterium]